MKHVLFAHSNEGLDISVINEDGTEKRLAGFTVEENGSDMEDAISAIYDIVTGLGFEVKESFEDEELEE